MPKQPATVKNAPLTLTTGRRKAAVARVWLRPGSGKVTINGREVIDYFPNPTHRQLLAEPLRVTETADVYDVFATIAGGARRARPVRCASASLAPWSSSTRSSGRR